ncbi:MAG: flagellar basal body rod C-terminal domain-containing protein [Kineosporiaceae bacterium]
MFEALGISGTSMNVHQTWMDAISDNIANINTVRPTSEEAFRARYVLAQSLEDGGVGSGVGVRGIELGNVEGRLVYSPDHPMADENGMVRLPDVDLGEQMTTMVMAQRGYQASASNLTRVKACYDAAIAMGR